MCVWGAWNLSSCYDQGFFHVLYTLELPTWEFPTHSLLNEEMHIGFHVEFSLLLSDLNQNQNVLVNFSASAKYQIS
jgi:hypothetical protein